MSYAVPPETVGSLTKSRDALLADANRALKARSASVDTNFAASSLEALVDGLLHGLEHGSTERAGDALREGLERGGVTHETALTLLGVVRRAFFRGILASGPAEAAGAAIDLVDEATDHAALALARATETAANDAREAIARGEAHHAWFFDNLPAMMHSIDATGKLSAVNDRWIEALGYSREEAVGRRSIEFLTGESARYAREVILPAFFETGRCDNVLYQFVRKDGTLMDVTLSAIAERDASGKVVRSQAVLMDVTAQLDAERAARAAATQEETIRIQQELLRAISTPLVPLGDGVLLMPLVGSIDEARAGQIMSVLLDGVVSHAAEVAILDVTGVPAMDGAVAEALANATKAVGLLGARVVLTGLGPAAARALIELGVDLGGITTKATLRDGLAAARRLARG